MSQALRSRLWGLVAIGLLGCTAEPPRRSEAPPPPPAAAQQPAAPAAGVELRIDPSVTYQVIEGFGATFNEGYDFDTGEDEMGPLRPRVIEAVHGQVGITMGQLEVGLFEGLKGRQTANDDDDPYSFRWEAFDFVRARRQWQGIVEPAQRFGFDNYTLRGGMNLRWSDPWLVQLRARDYQRYLAEAAENSVAPLVYWRQRYGYVPRWFHPFNEPLSGNAELAGASLPELVDLVKAVGARLQREGFNATRLVVASEETEETSLRAARAILADPEARRYVGAISFHTYPYGSVYSDVRRILATAGQGKPDAERVRVRGELQALAVQHGLQVWMTEVSHSNTPLLLENLLGRATHVHDELLYAGVSSYWAMFQTWNTHAKRGTCGDDCLVWFDRVRGTVSIGGTGYAIGHYARWLRRGALRVEARSEDARVLVSAFRDESRRRIVAVIVNHHRDAMTARLALALPWPGALAQPEGEQSSREGFWKPVSVRQVEGRVLVELPGRSVTTIALGAR